MYRMYVAVEVCENYEKTGTSVVFLSVRFRFPVQTTGTWRGMKKMRHKMCRFSENAKIRTDGTLQIDTEERFSTPREAVSSIQACNRVREQRGNLASLGTLGRMRRLAFPGTRGGPVRIMRHLFLGSTT